MLIHPRDAATGPAEWQAWLATTGRFEILAGRQPRPGPGPPSSPASSPKAATPPWPPARRRTGGCCPASAASG